MRETPPIAPENLDGYLASTLSIRRCSGPTISTLFMEDRQAQLLRLIEQATGQAVYRGEVAEEDAETDAETAEAELTMAAA